MAPKFFIAASHFMMACAASRAHSDLAKKALIAYGDHGALVSGCVRDHFPNEIKEELRRLAQTVTRELDAAYVARPPRVRLNTMRELGRDIATRDGSGFYGPQARRN